MSSFLTALSGNLARFVYAWLMPSATAVAIFAAFVLPYAPGPVALPKDAATLEAALLFILVVLILSLLFAYVSLPIYRFLEGYTMPRWLARPLRKRRLREWYRLHQTVERAVRSGAPDWQVSLESLARYPESPEQVLPTKLGNALRAMEQYGVTSYGLDSQTFWYELQSVAGDNLRRDTEDARAGVDFFISAVVHLALLAVASAAVAVASLSLPPAIVALGSLLAIPFAYNQAVGNVGDWRAAVQALVNVGRTPLSAALGLRMPATFEGEREMWENMVDLVNYGPKRAYLRALNPNRLR